jgi:hypothetical protein
MQRRPLTPELLHQLFVIDFARGLMSWRANRTAAARKGSNDAGCVTTTAFNKSYCKVAIDGKRYGRGHLIYFAYHGVWPRPLLDHINGDSLDDRVANLRAATRDENARNVKHRPRRVGGIDLPMGVFLYQGRKGNRFGARVRVAKRVLQLGTFPTVEEANQAYWNKRREIFGDFA